jgi:hypothetical protein
MKITYDSELIEQVVGATPLAQTKEYYVMRDEKHLPLLFSIGTDGICYIIYADELGRNQLKNLSAPFKVDPSHKVEALAVYQAPNGLISLAFAHRKPDGVSSVKITKFISPNVLMGEEKDLKNLLLQDQVLDCQVYDLLVVGSSIQAFTK